MTVSLSHALRGFAVLSILLAVPARAEAPRTVAIEEKNVLSGKQAIDPAKGYIFIRSAERSLGSFIKQPNAEELAEYEADWRKALDRAKKRYPAKLSNWEGNAAIARRVKEKVPEKPEEPTEENFSIGDIELRLISSFGPQYVYSKADGSYSYLMQVEPGTYTYHGPVSVLPNGVGAGLCYCMGSVKLEVKPGVITNLGDFLSRAKPDGAQARAEWAQQHPGEAFAIAADSGDHSLPTSLSGYTVVQPQLHAAGKMNNLYGVMIGRMTPVAGVLGYDRDTVIDLAGHADADARVKPVAGKEESVPAESSPDA